MTAHEIVEGLKKLCLFIEVEGDKQLITAAIAYIEASEKDRAALKARIEGMVKEKREV